MCCGKRKLTPSHGHCNVCWEAWAGCATAFEIKSLSVAWNNTFRNFCNSCWRESPRSLQFYCGCLPACYLIDQRRLLFWKKMLTSDNVLLRIPARLCQLKTVALAAKYGIFQLGSCSVRDVKCGIFSTFRNTVLWLMTYISVLFYVLDFCLGLAILYVLICCLMT